MSGFYIDASTVYRSSHLLSVDPGSNPGTVSSYNSTSLSLLSSETYSGQYEDVSDYATISMLVIVGSGESCTLYADISIDNSGTNTQTKSYTITSTTGYAHTLSVVSQYFRIRIAADQGTNVNGAVQVIYHQTRNKQLTTTIGEPITSDNDSELVRAVLAGSTTGSQYVNIAADAHGYIKTKIADPISQRGTMIADVLTPVVQCMFAYDYIDSQLFETFTASGGTATVTDSVLSLTTSSTIGSYAVVRSKRRVHYRPGQGLQTSFSAIYGTPVALSTQQAGLGVSGDSFMIGYNGTQFSVLRSYNGLIEVRELTVTAAATGAETATITLNGVAVNVNLTNAGGTEEFTAYEIANGDFSSAGFDATAVGATVVFSFAGVGSKPGTYSFSSTGAATGTFVQIKAGRDDTKVWTPQSSFSDDTLDGTGASGMVLDPQKGNVYKIEFIWHGFGVVSFSVQEPETGEFIHFHHIQYPNAYTIPSITIPSLSLQWAAASLGTTTPITFKTASGAAFNEGIIRKLGSRYAYSSTKTSITFGTETNMLLLRNATYFKGRACQTEITLQNITIANDSNKNATVNVYLNPTSVGDGTTSDYSSFINHNSNSSVQVDTTSVTVVGGTLIQSIAVPKNASSALNLEDIDLIMERGDILAITITLEATGDATVVMNWIENH